MDSLSYQTPKYWRDYSTNAFSGAVFTLTVASGRLLLAALSVFVTLVSQSTWSILSFALHQWRARDQPAQDGLYFQSQVLLRHPVPPGATITELLFMWWAWHRRNSQNRVAHLKRRLLVILAPALLVFGGFSAAGVFVSKVAHLAYESSDVLLNPVSCGAWGFNLSVQAGKAAARDKNANDTRNARAYAQNCYDQHLETGICSLYPKARIEFNSSDTPCPFGTDSAAEDACLYGQNQAMRLDTGLLNSNHIFGINTAPENQVLVRKILTCSPFHASNYLNQSLSPDGGYTIWNFGLGPLAAGGLTSDYTYSYNTYGRQAGIGFTLYSVSTVDNVWQPVQALSRSDADVSAHFLSQNSVTYEQEVDDIWFSAKDTEGQIEGYYGPSQYTNVLMCAEQHQLVNPVTKTQSSLSTVQGLADIYQQLGFNAYQEAIAQRFILSFSLSAVFNTVTNLGPSALLASDRIIELVGTGLPNDQWQREVRSWFETSLARIQWVLIEYNANTVNPGDYGFVSLPSKTSADPVGQAQNELCYSQRVRNTGNYQTFSLAGVSITAIVGGFLYILSLSLERCVKSHRAGNDETSHRETARIADNKYHLLRKNLRPTDQLDDRMAWDNVSDDIPVARSGMTFWMPRPKAGDYSYDPLPSLGQRLEHEDEAMEMALMQSSLDHQQSEAENLHKGGVVSSQINLLHNSRTR